MQSTRTMDKDKLSGITNPCHHACHSLALFQNPTCSRKKKSLILLDLHKMNRVTLVRGLRLVAAQDINSSQHFKRRIMSLLDALLQVSSFSLPFFMFYIYKWGQVLVPVLINIYFNLVMWLFSQLIHIRKLISPLSCSDF